MSFDHGKWALLNTHWIESKHCSMVASSLVKRIRAITSELDVSEEYSIRAEDFYSTFECLTLFLFSISLLYLTSLL